MSLLAMIAEKQLPISLVDTLVPLLRKLHPKDERLKKVQLGRSKASTIISGGFGSGLKNTLVEKLKERWFSVIIDETTDVTVDSQLAVMVQYWDPAESKMMVDVLDYVKCTDATADVLSQAVIERLNSLGIRSRFVGFCADTCNVMFGKNHSVSTSLSEEFPFIVVVKCSCHSCNLVANYAVKAFSEELETTMKQIFAHFSRSSARRRIPGQTRWLSLHNSVQRLLEQLQPLILYFTVEVADDKSKLAIDILTYLKHPQTEPFLNFPNYTLGCLTEFNTIFQSESPFLHELEDRVGALIKDFASNFMLLDYTRATSPANIDPWLAREYQLLNKIYLGPENVEGVKHLSPSDLESRRKSVGVFTSKPSPNSSRDMISARIFIPFCKCSSRKIFPNLLVVVSYLFSLPNSNAIVERLFSFLKLTKTDHRGALKEDTILGLMRMKYFMKNTDTKSYSVQFPDELVQRVLQVRANKTLGDTTSQPTVVEKMEDSCCIGEIVESECNLKHYSSITETIPLCDLTLDEQRVIKLRVKSENISFICRHHLFVFLTYYNRIWKKSRCCDPYSKHGNKSVKGDKTITLEF
ncbi:Cc8L18.2-like protein [Daphnia magna]|uniref:Cc8L18.2-like protein n=1 Tax=Daphnia magna TaxID=35525 RepID=A0A162CJ92_9CRUS|nr:Cc8L18.2-like protein [Daphnia magna]